MKNNKDKNVVKFELITLKEVKEITSKVDAYFKKYGRTVVGE